MKINYSDQEVIPSKNSIFLAGPTPRSSEIVSWRKEAVELLKSLNFDGVVYVPEKEFEDGQYDYISQAGWERSALYSAGIIVFWVPRELPHMPAFTTNVEFGYWLAKDKSKVVFGRPDNAQKVKYLDWLYKEETQKTPHTSLKALLSAAMNK